MKRTSREKRQRPQASTPRPSPASSPPAATAGTRDLKSLSRAELMARILELQAQDAARAASTPPPAEAPAAEPVDAPVVAVTRAAGLVIDSSVRSGQTIEFPEGDVTVIGSVGSGAEIVAGGSIHVYGTLRGRAIAGTSGDPTARIFCQDLDAELLSIDGRYRVAENFDPKLRGRPVQARLDGMRMALVPLETLSGPGAEGTAEDRAAADKIRRATDRVRQLISIGGWREARLTEAAAS